MFNFDYTFHWLTVWHALPEMLSAAWISLQLAVLSMLIGLLCAIPLSLIKTLPHSVWRPFAVIWIEVARNTPALFQLYMIYFGLGALGIHLNPYLSVLIAIGFNNAGYLAEVLRGGFSAIPLTQISSARSLGMTAFQAYTRIVIPQVLRIVYYPMTNQMIWSLLMTSLGTLVGLLELTGKTDQLQSLSFRTFEFYLVAAALYFIMAKIILLGAKGLAHNLFKSDAHA